MGYTWSANVLRTMNYLFFVEKFHDSNDPGNEGYFYDDEYSVNGALYYVDKLLMAAPGNFKKNARHHSRSTRYC